MLDGGFPCAPPFVGLVFEMISVLGGSWVMVSIAIDVGIANTLHAIDEIMVRHESEEVTVWDSLGDQLQAVLLTVGDLDRMYFALLAEIEDIFEQPELSPGRINEVIGQARQYCADEQLTLRLVEWRGAIQATAFNETLKHRRYRDLASTLRSIDDPLERYIARLWRLQTENAPEVPAENKLWDLRTVLVLLTLISDRVTGPGAMDKALPSPRKACEEAIRNYNRALSLALAQLIGHARQDLAMDRL